MATAMVSPRWPALKTDHLRVRSSADSHKKTTGKNGSKPKRTGPKTSWNPYKKEVAFPWVASAPTPKKSGPPVVITSC